MALHEELVAVADVSYLRLVAEGNSLEENAEGVRRETRKGFELMTWIKTVPMSEADERLRRAIEAQRELYPKEYADPVHPVGGGETSGIVASHSLIPGQ